MSVAIAKALPTCIDRTRDRVGFARDRKLLRYFTNSRGLATAWADPPVCTTGAAFGPMREREVELGP